MTVTCGVCGATVEPALDCPVCGAVLPEPAVEAPDDEPADDPAPDAPDPTPRPPTHLPPPLSAPPPPPPPSYGLPPMIPPPPAAPGTSIPSDARSYAVLVHLSAFVAAFFLVAFVGPLVLWLARRDSHAFIDHHGREALDFNLSMLLYGVVGVMMAVLTIGVGLLVVVPAGIVLFGTWIVAPIIAAVRASRGEGFRYPVTIRFLSR